MQLDINEIILWPKSPAFEPRRLPFEPNKVNVITGDSGTGKTAIGWIIDYCLGASKCRVPVGRIRDTVQWFGLKMTIAGEQMLVARRNPGDQQAAPDVYFDEGSNIEVPPAMRGRTVPLAYYKARLNELARLPNIPLTSDTDTAFAARPGFRDVIGFCFQPQHIIANPNTLFFRTDESEYRQRMVRVLPFALGAVSVDFLEKQEQLALLRQRIGRIERELRERRAELSRWMRDVKSHYAVARDLGLLTGRPEPDGEWLPQDYLRELSSIPARLEDGEVPSEPVGFSSASLNRLRSLVADEDELTALLAEMRLRYSRIDALKRSISEVGSDARWQEDRLSGVGWFKKKFTNAPSCPVCGHERNGNGVRLDELEQFVEQVTQTIAETSRATPSLEKEGRLLLEEISALEARLGEARAVRRALEADNADAAVRRRRVSETYRYVGRIERVMEEIRALGDESAVDNVLRELIEQEKTLKEEIGESSVAVRVRTALESLSYHVLHFAMAFGVANQNSVIKLHPNDLNLTVSGPGDRKDKLWEIGSGKNWMSFHLALLLGLHRMTAALKSHHVPRFLFLDQPSQVFFPEKPPTVEELAAPPTDDIRTDIAEVRLIFEVLDGFIPQIPSGHQVVVVEHAGTPFWEGRRNVHLVANWHRETSEDKGLIPVNWPAM